MVACGCFVASGGKQGLLGKPWVVSFWFKCNDAMPQESGLGMLKIWSYINKLFAIMDYVYEYYITVISTQASIGVHMLLACSVLCCNAMHRSAVNRECYDMLLYMPPTHMRTHTHTDGRPAQCHPVHMHIMVRTSRRPETIWFHTCLCTRHAPANMQIRCRGLCRT